MKVKLLVGLLALLILGIVFYAYSQRDASLLTTNLDLENKTILDTPDSEASYNNFPQLTWLDDLVGESLALVSGRYVHVREGMRKEEVAGLLAKHLDWDEAEINTFATAPEGQYYPGTYLLSESKDSHIVREVMQDRFEREITDKYASSTKKIISIPTAIKIASLIEREAGGKSDMRLISGIIWNRIWAGMPLQMDATLQYAKGTEELGWWPKVLPEDKNIVSPYNTYMHDGFPPAPIANPGYASVHAALNPIKTKCLYYLHDKLRRIHCSPTYAGHLKNINKYY